MLRWLLLWIPVLLLGWPVLAGTVPKAQAAVPPSDVGSEPEPEPSVRDIWGLLGSSSNRCPEIFDYHPDGGMRIFACHMASWMDLEALQKSVGMPIFLSGPHAAGKLDLQSRSSFGHYNPAFVAWASQALIPGAEDSAFRVRIQAHYIAIVRPLARTHYQVWQKLHAPANARCVAAELDAYKRVMAGGKTDSWGEHYERWYDFMEPSFCASGAPAGASRGAAGLNGNVVITVVGFWLRRRLDGTAAAWHDALVRLLEAYDGPWLASARSEVQAKPKQPSP
jgi:hypothetical protein